MEKQADWLIAGLGNPGRRYEKTRHNIGWMVVSELCNKYQKQLFPYKNICLLSEFIYAGQKIIAIMPTTFMNLSGEAVAKVKNDYNIPLENIVVISDEYNFPLSKVHLKKGGSSGGHNGIESIIEYLNSNNFIRLRCGIDKNFIQGEMIEYVLSKFNKNELDNKNLMINKAIDSIEFLINYGIVKAMTYVNSEELWKENITA